MKSTALKWGVTAIALSMVAGCVTRADLEEIKTNQKDILTKLEKVEQAGPAARPAPQRPRGPDPSKVYAFPVGQSHTKGPKDAWVTIVEVSDFQCPFCNRVNPTLKQVQDKYGDDVRIAFKHNALPFHQRAKPAAKAAECAGDQGKFWEMHDQLFANQRQLEDADLEKYAAAVGVNMGEWKSCYNSNKHDAKIDGDQRQASALGARGTPAFFINGRYLSGAQPLASFERLIDEELKKAKESGLSKSEYYAKAVMEKGAKNL